MLRNHTSHHLGSLKPHPSSYRIMFVPIQPDCEQDFEWKPTRVVSSLLKNPNNKISHVQIHIQFLAHLSSDQFTLVICCIWGMKILPSYIQPIGISLSPKGFVGRCSFTHGRYTCFSILGSSKSLDGMQLVSLSLKQTGER